MKNIFNIVVSFTVLGLLFVVSCKPEITPTIAEIRVVTEDGIPVPFANILLTCTSSVNQPCDIEIEGTADENGVYSREFELPKVLEVTSAGNIYDTIITGTLPDTQMTFSKDTICNTSFISIKPEETSILSITLYDCK
ncbi:MAG: hypothetical protein ACJAWO_001542 [Halieaceae bacterium]|jgi:hypothetical protein